MQFNRCWLRYNEGSEPSIVDDFVPRKILVPIEDKEEIKSPEEELKEARAKIQQLESVLHYGVEMGKMVPRFEYMVLEAKVEEAKFQQAQAEEKLEAAVKMLDLPAQLRFMEPTTDSRFRALEEAFWDVREENRALKSVLRNLRETAERLRVPIDEELLQY